LRCLAAPSKLRGAITPTPRQQGIEIQGSPISSRFVRARLLKQIFALDLERCPRCHQGALRIIAAIPSGLVIRRILFDLKLAADPPPLALARLEPDRFAWAFAQTPREDGVFGPPTRTRYVRSV
jgi:hypothetical protein